MNSNLQAFSQTLTAREMYTQVSNYSPVEVGDQQIRHYRLVDPPEYAK